MSVDTLFHTTFKNIYDYVLIKSSSCFNIDCQFIPLIASHVAKTSLVIVFDDTGMYASIFSLLLVLYP